MAFLRPFFAGVVLVALTLIVQSAGMAALISWAKAHFSSSISRFGSTRNALLVVRFASLIVCLHILEILVWACFFRWKCFPAWESAFYFSATSYSTVGYGDIIPAKMWRALGPVESLTGMLMCGVSVSVLFAIVARLVARDEEKVLARTFERTAERLVDETAQHAASPPPGAQK